MLDIIPIPALKDNYIWALVDAASAHCAIVDPGDAEPVLAFLRASGLKLCAILITHHHWDHTAGVSDLLKHCAVPVFGPAGGKVTHIDHPVKENDNVTLHALGVEFRVLEIPGHTLDHIAYYGHQALFCGDTLFSAGCGRLFEGTAAQLYSSLTRLSALPDETLIYCAHEYTAANLRFAQTVEPDNQDIALRIDDVAALGVQSLPTLPSTLQIEKRTNPFLRCHHDSVVKSVRRQTSQQFLESVTLFQALRAWKDTF